MSGPSNSRIDPTIIAALIGVCGTVMVALLSILAPRLLAQTEPTPLPTSTPVVIFTPTITNTPVPTDTVPAGDPTSTPAPDTPTPEPTFTLAPPAIGEDWETGCISTLWTPVPMQTGEINGCRSEPVNNIFFADAGSLKFLVDRRFENNEVYGMFAPLPASGTASISVLLRRLQEGEVWMGVFAAPDVTSQGVIIVVPPGDVQKRALVQKTMPEQFELQQKSFDQNSALYDVVFEFGNGSVTTTIMSDTVFNTLPVNGTPQWLFVGFQSNRGNNRIDAEFLNLSIQGQ